MRSVCRKKRQVSCTCATGNKTGSRKPALHFSDEFWPKTLSLSSAEATLRLRGSNSSSRLHHLCALTPSPPRRDSSSHSCSVCLQLLDTAMSVDFGGSLMSQRLSSPARTKVWYILTVRGLSLARMHVAWLRISRQTKPSYVAT